MWAQEVEPYRTPRCALWIKAPAQAHSFAQKRRMTKYESIELVCLHCKLASCSIGRGFVSRVDFVSNVETTSTEEMILRDLLWRGLEPAVTSLVFWAVEEAAGRSTTC